MIPLATTTIRVERPDTASSNYETSAFTVTAQGIRAVIGSPAGIETLQGGSKSSVEWRMNCDPIALTAVDEIVDERTAERYAVLWAKQRQGFGLEHTVAGLRQVIGVAGG